MRTGAGPAGCDMRRVFGADPSILRCEKPHQRLAPRTALNLFCKSLLQLQVIIIDPSSFNLFFFGLFLQQVLVLDMEVTEVASFFQCYKCSKCRDTPCSQGHRHMTSPHGPEKAFWI